MHEITIVENALEIVLEKAQEHYLAKITKVTLAIGEMAGVMGEAIQFAFRTVSQNTIAGNAELEIEWIKPTARCEKCNLVFPISHFHRVCPECHQFSSTIVTGYELYVKSIEG